MQVNLDLRPLLFFAEREGNVPFPFILLYYRCLSNPANR